MNITVAYVAVFLFGGLFGLAELLSRYRAEPKYVLQNWAAAIYILINGLASLLALNLIQVFGWFEQADASLQTLYKEVLIAGFSAMALFRSSLFIIRTENGQFGFGPVYVLQILLDAVNDSINRHSGGLIFNDVSRMMKEISFDKAKISLPALCFGLLTNFPEEKQQQVKRELESIEKNQETSAKLASALLGLTLLKIVGKSSLDEAIKFLKDEIKND